MAKDRIYLERSALRDRIYACWMGKNIGGTFGGPYENMREILDIQGFATKAGEPLPNDDLDLQLIWLKAVGDRGPKAVNERLLGEYWLSYIGPHWNEYGVGKSNLREGFVPPLSGEINNNQWKHSNGAWIRTEIWACLFPADPETAIRYSYYDACVDHGFGEGTYAAIFVAAMESAAFVIHDVRELLKLGLSKIPADCRTAQCVRTVIEGYDKGEDWKKIRNRLVDDTKDIGWFQAPANIGFVVTGLLYGEGDFKKSMTLATNCGDDTDCTAATIGSLMGIMKGTAGLPEDWIQYVGEEIKTICLLNGHGQYPKDCTELTDAVMELLPITLGKARFSGWDTRLNVIIGDHDDLSDFDMSQYYGTALVDELSSRSQYSFTEEGPFCSVLVEYDTEPRISPNGTLSGKISVKSTFLPEQKHYQLRWWTEDGWSVESPLNLHDNRGLSMNSSYHDPGTTVPFTIHASETVRALNKVVLEVSSLGRVTPVYLALVIMG